MTFFALHTSNSRSNIGVSRELPDFGKIENKNLKVIPGHCFSRAAGLENFFEGLLCRKDLWFLPIGTIGYSTVRPVC